MEKIDLKKQWKELYSASAKDVQIVQVPALNRLAVDGCGNPNSAPAYQEAMEALYSLSYTLKFMHKQRPNGTDYTVMPLEGLWWVPNMAEFSLENKDAWQWTALIVQPDFVTADDLQLAIQQLQRKGKDPAVLERARLERVEEGLAVQIMHLGPYADEAPTIARLHAFIAEQGFLLSGKHHEIYLGDPRRTAPEKLKTIIRQPMHRPTPQF